MSAAPIFRIRSFESNCKTPRDFAFLLSAMGCVYKPFLAIASHHVIKRRDSRDWECLMRSDADCKVVISYCKDGVAKQYAEQMNPATPDVIASYTQQFKDDIVKGDSDHHFILTHYSGQVDVFFVTPKP